MYREEELHGKLIYTSQAWLSKQAPQSTRLQMGAFEGYASENVSDTGYVPPSKSLLFLPGNEHFQIMKSLDPAQCRQLSIRAILDQLFRRAVGMQFSQHTSRTIFLCLWSRHEAEGVICARRGTWRSALLTQGLGVMLDLKEDYKRTFAPVLPLLCESSPAIEHRPVRNVTRRSGGIQVVKCLTWRRPPRSSLWTLREEMFYVPRTFLARQAQRDFAKFEQLYQFFHQPRDEHHDRAATSS